MIGVTGNQMDWAPLASNESRAQDWQDTWATEQIMRRVRADVWAPKAGTLYLDQTDKEDKSGVSSTSISVLAETRTELPWTVLTKRFYRLRFANDAAAQTSRMYLTMQRSQKITVDANLQVGNADVGATNPAPVSLQGSDVVYDTPTHAAVAVGTSSTKVLEANASRRYALFVNKSDTEIVLMFGAAANLSTGIPVVAGASYEMNTSNLYRGVVNAIQGADGTTKELRVVEGV